MAVFAALPLLKNSGNEKAQGIAVLQVSAPYTATDGSLITRAISHARIVDGSLVTEAGTPLEVVATPSGVGLEMWLRIDEPGSGVGRYEEVRWLVAIPATATVAIDTLVHLEPADVYGVYVPSPEVQTLLDAATTTRNEAAASASAAATSATTAGTARDEAVSAKNAAQAVGTTTDGVMTGVDGNAASTFRVQSDARLSATIDGAVAPAVAAAAAATAAAGTNPSVPFTNVTPANFRKWRRALARSRTGAAVARVLCAGDSTTFGVGSGLTYVPDGGYAAELVKLLAASGRPATQGLAIPQSSYSGSPNNARWSLGTGWVANMNGFANHAAYQGTAAVADSMTYTPGYNCDTFDVYYLKTTTTSTVDVRVNSEAVTTLATNNSVRAVGKATITVTAGAGTGHVLKFGPTAVSSVWIVGVDAYLAAERKIRVGNAGVNGSNTADWATDALLFNSTYCIQAYQPDLTIISLGINDSQQGVSVAAWTANVAKVVDAAKVTGDVLLMSVFPSDAVGNPATEALYRDAAKALAVSKSVGFLDLFSRFGSFAAANADGMMFDPLHPTRLGYADAAGAVHAAITSVG